MADFLNRLAARALGATPLAEPVIPTRFSPKAETNAFLAFEPTPQSTRPFSETAPATSEDRLHPLHIHEADLGSETRMGRPPSPFQDLDEAPHPPLSQRPHAFRTQPLPPFAEREIVQPSIERTEVRKQHLATALNPNPGTIERTTAPKPQATLSAPVPFAEPQPTPRLAPFVEPKRSTVMQHPGALSALRPAPPTVRISIGRIEVRAEIASPVPTASAQRPRPSTLSLDQFLKQAGRAR
jgi:hypothetical protein